jgi:hypothetical protein
MSIRPYPLAMRLLLAPLFFLILPAHAEPYLAVQTGFKCGQCHVNPTGGGERNVFGNVFAQTQLPARRIDTGSDVWTGDVTKFLSVGGDLRFDGSYSKVPQSPSVDQFQMEQTRIYVSASVIPQRLLVYVDEQVAPGGAVNEEAYGLYWSANHDWYVKAGQMYLPFGLRLQDQSAFVRQASGINMTTPDRGAEFGWERGAWDAQFTVSNGTAGGPVSNNGKQYGGQLIYVQSLWRLGLAANYNDAAATGGRGTYGAFAGVRTGPIAWLGEADYINDRSLGNSAVKMVATLAEANWRIAQGHNLKVTGEFLDPNRDIAHNGRTRWSLVYELTPIQFVQLRAGVRYSQGIPQAPAENARLFFVQLHGFF